MKSLYFMLLLALSFPLQAVDIEGLKQLGKSGALQYHCAKTYYRLVADSGDVSKQFDFYTDKYSEWRVELHRVDKKEYKEIIKMSHDKWLLLYEKKKFANLLVSCTEGYDYHMAQKDE